MRKGKKETEEIVKVKVKRGNQNFVTRKKFFF